jgi:hypothetical protein
VNNSKSLHEDFIMRQFLATIMTVVFTSWIAAEEPGIAQWNPSTDLVAMQGEWRLDPELSRFFSETALESIVKAPERQRSSVQFKGNNLHLSDGTVLVFTNDLRIAGAEAADRNCHVICFIMPDIGAACLGAYRIDGDNLVVRYPHTSVCSRSGNIAIFTRSKEKNPQNQAIKPTGGSGEF